MIEWHIVGGDWKTPLKKGGGRGKAKDMREACAGIREWVKTNMAHLADRTLWRFVKPADDNATVVDFGSHSHFARIEEDEG